MKNAYEARMLVNYSPAGALALRLGLHLVEDGRADDRRLYHKRTLLPMSPKG